MKFDAKKYVNVPQNNDKIMYEDGDTSDIIKVIEIADKIEVEQRNVKNLAAILRGPDEFQTCKKIWYFVKENIKYRADAAGYERIKLANKTGVDGYGDCKSFSILIASLLRELGIKAKYRFVSWKQSDDITHVYIVAKLKGGEEILMDAVHTRFNDEVKYAYKKEKNSAEMSKIALVSGPPNAVNTPSFFDYSQMTDGEFSLQIQKERLKLLLTVHPNAKDEKNWRRGIQMIENAIYKGVHGVSANTGILGFLPNELNFIARKIKESKTRFAPAADALILNKRKHVGDGTDPIIQNMTYDSCGAYPILTANNSSYYQYQLKNYNDCKINIDKQNELRDALNRTMPTTSHHYIYEFADPRLTQNNATTSFATKLKITQHKQVIPQLVFASKLSQSNLTDWARLSIERQHAKENLGVMSPEDAIKTLQDYKKTWKYDSAGNPIPAIGCPPCFVILAVAVLTAIAFKGIGGLMQIARDKEPTAFDNMDSILKAGFSAQGGDWTPDLSGTGGGNGGGGTTGQSAAEIACNARTGYTWNPLTNTCDLNPADSPNFVSKYGLPIGAAAAAYFILKD
jgi:predicted transglutaminase-like cysteine proteinase